MAGLVLRGFGYLLYLAIPGVAVFTWYLVLLSRREERRQGFLEVLATGSMALIAPAGMWAGLGRPDPQGWWLWLLVWAQSASSIVFVYYRLAQRKGGAGRDHHIKGFSMWLAGGPIKGGTAYGETDELGYNAVKDVVHVRDLHATMLHLLGIDHNRFSVKFQGLDMRLTGVEPARVVKDVLV